LFPEHSEEEIYRKSGVKYRYVRKDKDTPSDLAVACALQMFEKNPEHKNEIDMLLYCAEILDHIAPATSCIIHERLGLDRRAGCMDIPMGCSGFTNGLALAKAMIESGQAEKILFITAETPTAVIHPDDLYLKVLFSDAACCSIVERSPTRNIGAFSFGTDGSGAKNLIVPRSGARDPADQQWHAKYAELSGKMLGRMEMKGDKILQFALREVPPLVQDILRLNHMTIDEVDWFVFHHASGLILKMLPRKLGIDPAKSYNVLELVGNTVSASIPIALQIGIDKGDIKKGQKILVCGFGIGFSWSGTIIEL
jgi:3-oxoacyl-[acyl-carrier-protein] synthase-3